MKGCFAKASRATKDHSKHDKNSPFLVADVIEYNNHLYTLFIMDARMKIGPILKEQEFSNKLKIGLQPQKYLWFT